MPVQVFAITDIDCVDRVRHQLLARLTLRDDEYMLWYDGDMRGNHNLPAKEEKLDKPKIKREQISLPGETYPS